MTGGQGSVVWPALKPWVLGACDLALIGLITGVKPLGLLVVFLGLGYAGYRACAGGKRALAAGEGPKALRADADFERRMHELEAEERQLDAKIRALEVGTDSTTEG